MLREVSRPSKRDAVAGRAAGGIRGATAGGAGENEGQAGEAEKQQRQIAPAAGGPAHGPIDPHSQQ